MHIVIGQDSEQVIIPSSVNCMLGLGDTKYLKTEDRTVFDFVGFVISDDSTLAVFPKHYYDDISFAAESVEYSSYKEDILLLFEVLKKYIFDERSTAKAEKYIGRIKEYESDFPFEAFFQIYDYYKKYGVYYEEIQRMEKGTRGKVSWKKTIQKAQVVVSNGNLVYIPLYSSTKNPKSAFISDCMVFAINYTLKLFPFFLSMKPVFWHTIKMDFIQHRQYVLQELHRCQRYMFKDIHKKLLAALIRFFEQINDKKHGGNIHVKINYFDKIWQTMVNKYLNDCFSGIDRRTGSILFNNTTSSNVIFGSRAYTIDKSGHNHMIELDHYGTNQGEQYIFDSKYYYQMKDLDYKQFVYDSVVDHYENTRRRLRTYSALLTPGNGSANVHLDLLKEYGSLSGETHQIIEQPVNVKRVMQHYVQS